MWLLFNIVCTTKLFGIVKNCHLTKNLAFFHHFSKNTHICGYVFENLKLNIFYRDRIPVINK